ncbi:WXG100 family type VII secretion target [Streptomyces sp. NPDC057067]|uniref:WXG100 family type VII secretion target n=1 Tax=unclassified Streptomyces TaxID=2593676 RepID=UPI00362CC7F4
MQRYLDRQVRRMDAVVDAIEARWRGPAAKAYRKHHREAAKEAVRIRELMKLLEAAVRMSRDGFTEQELETLAAFKRAHPNRGCRSWGLKPPVSSRLRAM